MDTRNAFVLDASEYNRDIDIITGTIDDNARYLSLITKDPMDQCREYVRGVLIPNEKNNRQGLLKDPKVLVLDKNKNGDRKPVQTSMLSFLSRVKKSNFMMSPSMTVYMQETERKSTHADYIASNVKKRSIVKREMFEAEQIGDHDTVVAKKGTQNNLKINNNSYSGATVSTATILHYKSTHSSLTSTCRVATSYANASNEKFIRGNRHYYSPEIVKANLVSIINLAPLDLIDQACKQFNLKYPSTDDVMDMVVMCSEHYWLGHSIDSSSHLRTIRTLVENMEPVHRAAVLYVGDLYQLYNHNKPVIRAFLEQMASVGDPTKTPVTDEEYNEIDDDTKLLATFLCYDGINNRKVKDLKKDDPAVYAQILATAGNVLETLRKHEILIKAFFLTKCLPSSIHAFPSIRRKAVPVSDTDSTMFTLMWWVEEFYGDLKVTPESRRLTFAMVFMISEVVMHILAILSRNMGVGDAKLRLLAMKNEYYFEVLMLSYRSKHYFASKDAQEGLMKRKAEMEIKGVGLRDSKVPPAIQDMAADLMEEIVNEVKAGRKIKMYDLLTRIADVERSIIKSLDDGNFEYLTTAQVKAPDSYKSGEDNSTYKQYLLWNEVMAPSFGDTPEPPYQAVKLSLATNNRTAIEAWCEQMGNKPLADRLRIWLAKEGKRELNTLIVPFAVVESSGIPKELTMAIDKRTIISNVMSAFYVILESLGIHIVEKNNIRLVSDYY